MYTNTVVGTLAVDEWTVTFGTVRRGLGGLRRRPVRLSAIVQGSWWSGFWFSVCPEMQWRDPCQQGTNVSQEFHFGVLLPSLPLPSLSLPSLPFPSAPAVPFPLSPPFPHDPARDLGEAL